MADPLLVRVADRNLRRIYASDIAGLTTFANGLATQSQGSPVTITSSGMDGSSAAGQVTMPREVWLLAAEELLSDPLFNANAVPRPCRVVIPDFRFSTPV